MSGRRSFPGGAFPRATVDVFASSSRAAFEAAAGDAAFARTRMTFREGGIAAATALYATDPSAGIVVVEDSGSEEELLSRLDALAEVLVDGTRVIVAGASDRIATYMSLLARGVDEYAPLPLDPGQIVELFASLHSGAGVPTRGKSIAVWGVKGGVGASTIAQNLAWSLASRTSKEVLYVDFDVPFGSSALAFDLTSPRSIVDVLSLPDKMDETLIERCLSKKEPRLSILPSLGLCGGSDPLRPEAVAALATTATRMADVVVLDVPHSWSDWSAQLLSMADEVVLVATPDLACLKNARSAMEALSPRRAAKRQPRVALNRANTARRSDVSAKDYEAALGVAPLVSVPSEPDVFLQAANEGRMLDEARKGDAAAALIGRLADELCGVQGAVARPVVSGGGPSFFSRLFRSSKRLGPPPSSRLGG